MAGFGLLELVLELILVPVFLLLPSLLFIIFYNLCKYRLLLSINRNVILGCFLALMEGKIPRFFAWIGMTAGVAPKKN
jgi:hypothetical protein